MGLAVARADSESIAMRLRTAGDLIAMYGSSASISLPSDYRESQPHVMLPFSIVTVAAAYSRS